MLAAVLSDIHANSHALKSVIKEINKIKPDIIFILGDLVGYYYHPDEVLQILDDFNTEIISGNHELMLKQVLQHDVTLESITKKYGSGIHEAIKLLGDKQINTLINLPETKDITLNDKSIKLCHGSPWDLSHYIYENNTDLLIKACEYCTSDVILLGHTHYPYVFKYNDKYVINPGSIGQSRLCGGIASWGLVKIGKEIKYFPKQTEFSVDNLYNEVKERDKTNTYLADVLKRRRANKI